MLIMMVMVVVVVVMMLMMMMTLRMMTVIVVVVMMVMRTMMILMMTVAQDPCFILAVSQAHQAQRQPRVHEAPLAAGRVGLLVNASAVFK